MLLYVFLSPFVIFILLLSAGGLGSMLIYHWAIDSDSFITHMIVAFLGELAWLSIIIFVLQLR